MDVDEIRLDMVRKNPLEFYSSGDIWIFNFAVLNFVMQTFKLRLNPNIGTDETVVDWMVLNDVSITEWFFKHYNDIDYFLPIES